MQRIISFVLILCAITVIVIYYDKNFYRIDVRAGDLSKSELSVRHLECWERIFQWCSFWCHQLDLTKFATPNYRLYELGVLHSSTQVIILDQENKAGGLASSFRDTNGFLWDNGGHVVFSHYKYFDSLLDKAVKDWNEHKRAAFAFMKGSSGERSFIPYPVQDNVMSMDKEDQKVVLKDLQHLIDNPILQKPKNFDEWLLKNFGNELSDIFMRQYNRKIWTVDPREMNAAWVGDRVAVPSMEKIKQNSKNAHDSQWGPNKLFRFPQKDGTGGIWTSVAKLLPQGWFHFGNKVVAIDITNKKLQVQVKDESLNDTLYDIKYDVLINTSPLDQLINISIGLGNSDKKKLANELVYTHTHIIGLGLRGKVPSHLSDKSWMYFPDSDSPFYRVTVFSKYADDHVPNPEEFWSLMCEAAQPKYTNNTQYWSRENLIETTVSALVSYGFISKNQIMSQYHHVLEHGYPVPSLKRDMILQTIQPWLESHNIYSRGRFGGWKYEVSNQDHAVMQGVEIADFLIRNISEETSCNPNWVNSLKASNRFLDSNPNKSYFQKTNHEIVVAHYSENVDWLKDEFKNVHLYHKGKETVPDFQFKQWEILPNVGRESHTYLHHIIHNYDRLSDITIFIQAGADNHKNWCYMDMKDYIQKAKKESYAVKDMFHFDAWGWDGKELNIHVRRRNITVGEFWIAGGLGDSYPSSINASWNGCFAATRERIHFRPLEIYKKLIKFVDDHSDPLEGHYLERLWHGIFFGN